MMEMDAPSDQALSSKKRKVISQVGETVSIPVDLLMDIVTRLSARDVLRYRSVCKEWNFLLRTPKFVSLHYNRSLQMRHENAADSLSFIYLRAVPPTPPENIALTFITLEKTTTKIVAKVDKEEDITTMLSSLLFPSRPTELDMQLQMICPFDGLICLGCGEHVVMYNPATRESQVLPSDPELSNFDNLNALCILGVWFESTMKQQYKVFRLVSGDNWCKIKIYDSTVNSWRESKNIIGSANSKSGLLLNGVVYFYMWKDFDPVIVTFDARLETFGYLEFPPSFGDGYFVSFLPIRGNLAFMNSKIEKDDYRTVRFNIWVMTEYGVEQSWTQISLGPLGDDDDYDSDNDDDYGSDSDDDGLLLAFWKNRNEQDELLVATRYGQTMSFNLNTQEKTNVKLPFIPYLYTEEYKINLKMGFFPFLHTEIIPYNVESLLSLKMIL